MNGTYIKLYRKIMDWEWYSNTNCVRVFLHLMLKAQWEDSEYQGVTIPRGSLVTGLKALSEQLGLSSSELRTALDRLSKCDAVSRKTTNRFSVITVCNFDTYNPQKGNVSQQSVIKKKAISKPVSKPEAKVIREVSCDETKRMLIFKAAKGYLNGLDYNNAWSKFVWICDQNRQAYTEERWTKYINKK